MGGSRYRRAVMVGRPLRTWRWLSAGPGLTLMLPALLMVLLLYGIPLVRLADISFGETGFSLAHYCELFASWSYGEILLRTVRLSAIVVVGCLMFGYPIGYVLAFSSARRRMLLSLLVLLPFWTSVLVRNFAWIYLLREGGVISTFAGLITPTGDPVRLMYNEAGVVAGMVSTLMPFMVFPVFVSIVSQKCSVREAAASLGASPERIFFSITLPLSQRGIFAGSLLVFAIAMGFFVTPALLGGGRVLMTATFISQQVEEFVNWPLSAAAGMVLLIIVILPLTMFRRATVGEDSGAHDETS
jgi:ABC-type spermidine/putrescine transport system permease subunit I